MTQWQWHGNTWSVNFTLSLPISESGLLRLLPSDKIFGDELAACPAPTANQPNLGPRTGKEIGDWNT